MSNNLNKKASFWDNATKTLLYGVPMMLLGKYIATCHFNPTVNVQQDTKPWSVQYTKNMYQKLYYGIDSLMDTEPSIKTAYCNCEIAKLKALAPRGIEVLSEETANSIYFQVGEECAKNIGGLKLKKWSSGSLDIFKHALMDNPDLQRFPLKKREVFCTCYLEQLQQIYPNGLTGKVSTNVQEKVVNKCAHFLK